MNYEQEAIKPYGAEEGKAQQVEQMFDNIAPSYDKLNHRLSWNIDKGWRRKAICQLEPHKPQTLLDIATGTGDFAILAAEMLRPTRLVGADISEGMMEVGRQKVREKGLDSIEEIRGAALDYVSENTDVLERDTVIFPKFNRDKCIGCGRCSVSCADGGHQAIRMNEDRRPVLNGKKCVGCHLCVLVCPQRAISSSRKRIAKP